MDLLYASASHLDAFRDWVEDSLEVGVDAGLSVIARTLPRGAAAPFYLLEPAQPGELRGPAGPPMAGDQWTHLVVTARSIGRTVEQAGRMADWLRWLVAGRDEVGGYRHPLPDLAGSPVIRRWSEMDVVPDVVAGIPQSSETLVVALTRGEVDEL